MLEISIPENPEIHVKITCAPTKAKIQNFSLFRRHKIYPETEEYEMAAKWQAPDILKLETLWLWFIAG